MRTPILACLAIASSAAAQPQPIVAAVERGLPVEPSRIKLGAVEGGTITKLSLTARNHPGHVHVTLTFTMATRSETAREVAIPFALSSQVAAIGLGLDSTEGKEVGVSMAPAIASSSYRDTVEYLKDPALLAKLGPGRFGLRVYPVSRDAPATVTIDLSLPYGAPFLLDRGTSGIREVAIDLGGEAQRRRLAGRQMISLLEAIEETTGEPEAVLPVDATMSLLAMPPERRSSRTGNAWSVSAHSTSFHDHVQTLPINVDLLGDRDVAREAKAHTEQLGHCFALGTSRSASLVLSVASTGEITAVRVDDLDDTDASDCIANQVASWTFRATRRARTLRHALEL
jgi:hypothetical protein